MDAALLGGGYPRVLPRVVDETLRGYGQIFFCGRRRSGLLVLLATMTCPSVGFCGLLGALAATLTSRKLPPREVLASQGLFACNGALAGLAVGVFAPDSPFVPAGSVLAGVLAAILLLGWSGVLARWRLPALSVPFVCVTWVVLPLLRALAEKGTPETAAVGPGAPLQALSALAAAFPQELQTPLDLGVLILQVLSTTVLTPGLVAGALCLLAAVVDSPRKGLHLAAAAAGGVAVAGVLMPAGVPPLLAAVNVYLTLLALAAVFLPVRRAGLAAAAVGASLSLIVVAALGAFLQPSGMPVVVAPFNVATLAVLAWWRQSERAEAAPQAEPVLDLAARPLLPSAPSFSPVVRLPFCGAWTVSQGPGGLPTHQGEGWHAWDFVVVDARRSTHRSLGLYLDDYYAFGLPVLAPADGVVVRVVDGIPDNPPSQDNLDENWGNLVIVDHGGGVCSEISHFQAGSIVVVEGQEVREGQWLGRCGSSGRSLEPHIHFQVQVGPALGAPTLPAVFSPYRLQGADGPVTRSPGEGEVVENVMPVGHAPLQPSRKPLHDHGLTAS